MREPRYGMLFTPMRIRPVTAKSRFLQVPHCSGMGHSMWLRQGDALASALIAHAIYAGHQDARELHEAPGGDVPFTRHFLSPGETDLFRNG